MSTQSSIISWVKRLFEYQVAYETRIARIEIVSPKGIKFSRDSIETDFSFELVKRVKFA